jgi:Domain of unknown function (DUF4218)
MLYCRELCRLRKKVSNKAHPECSMVEAYIIEEILNFYSIYFKSDVRTRLNQNPSMMMGESKYLRSGLQFFLIRVDQSAGVLEGK